MQASGWPDLFVAHKYWKGFLEMKGEKTVLRTLQIHILSELVERKVPSLVIRYPNLILNVKEKQLAVFDGTGLGLLRRLRDVNYLD